MATKKPDEYISIWNFPQSERQSINVKRMVFLSEEQDFQLKKNLREKLKNEHISSGLNRDEEFKKNKDKFYLHADIKNFDGDWRRLKGFSIFRHQIPELISILQDIINGKYDDKMQIEISKLLKKSPESKVSEKKSGAYFSLYEYKKWKEGLDWPTKQQILQMEQMGMKKEDIRKNFDPNFYMQNKNN